MSAHARFRPFSRAMALEPRILFDGAAAVAGADAMADDPYQDTGYDTPASDAGHASAGDALILLVVDARVPDYESLLAGLPANVQVRVVDRDESGVGAVGAALAEGNSRYEAVHILSHGEPGSLTLGRDTLSLDTLSDHTIQLQSWGAYLTADADILLYGCDIAASDQGRLLIHELAMWTGADIAASTDATGAEHLGGDWNLGAWTGQIDAALPFDRLALAGYGALLTERAATDLSVADVKPLIGETINLQVTFDNTGADPAYGPFVDLFINRRGADGSTSDVSKFDGLSIQGATYLGAEIQRQTFVLVDTVPEAGQLRIVAGQVTHPITGESVDVPAGFGVGDQLTILTLPFGSFTPDQPAAVVDVALKVHQFADPGTPLKVVSRGGYMFGSDPLDNPGIDAPIWGSVDELTITPQAFTVTAELIAPEGETATGPNFVRYVDVTIKPAAGTTLSDNTRLHFPLPDGLVLANFTPPAGWTVETSPAYDIDTDNDVLILKRADGQTLTSTTVVRVPFYVTEHYQTGTDVLDAGSGDVRSFSFDNIQVTDGRWEGMAGSALLGATADFIAVVSEVTTAPTLTARSVQVIKDDIYKVVGGTTTALGSGTVRPGDLLEYHLRVDVSDFFRTGSVVVTDTLPDGLTFDSSYGPMLEVSWQDADGGSPSATVAFDPENIEVRSADGLTWTPWDGSADPLVTQTANGKTEFRFNLSAQLAGSQLLGGLVTHNSGETQGVQNGWAPGAAGTGATTAVIKFRAEVEENYRTSDPLAGGITNQNLKERDELLNNARVEVEIIQRENGTTVTNPNQFDVSAEGVQLPAGQMSLEITRIVRGGTVYTGAQLADMTLAPGDEVTYRLTYDLPIGDYENLALDAYLPLPVFDLDTMGQAANGNTPGVDQWSIGNDTTAGVSSVGVTVGANNRITFDLGDSGPVDSAGSKLIELFFTAQVTDAPFADRLLLTTQGQHQDSSSQAVAGTTSAINQITLSQADVHVYKAYTGLTNEDGVGAGASVDELFSPSSQLNSGNIQGIGASDASGFNGGDTVRVLIAVENQGSSARGAYDVTVRDHPDVNLEGDHTTLTFRRGNGTLVTDVEIWNGTAWVSTSVAGNGEAVLTALQSDDGIRFVDGGAVGALERGKNDAGAAVNDGSNVIYISYEATVKETALVGSDSTSQASLLRFANVEGSDNFIGDPRFDKADISYLGNEVELKITATVGHDDTDAASAVIGEYIDYELTINLAEGRTSNGQIVVNLGSGLGLVDVAGVTAVGMDNVPVNYSGFGTDSSIGGTVLDAAGDGTISASLSVVNANSFTVNLGDIINAEHDDGAETLTLTFRAIPLNTSGNNAGDAGADQRVTARFSQADDPDSATVTIREPQLTADITASHTTVSADNVVTYTLTVTNNTNYAAHDVSIADFFDGLGEAYLIEKTFGSVLTTGSGITSGGTDDWLTVGIGVDKLEAGESITMVFTAKVAPGTPFGASLEVDPTITWTSLPVSAGDATDRSSIVDGATNDSERTGADGAGGVNDYSQNPSVAVTFASPTPVLVIDATSEASTGANTDAGTTEDDVTTDTVTIGEIVRLRMVVELPESTSAGVSVTPTLPAGLQYMGDATVALVSNTSITSSILDTTGSLADLQHTGGDATLVNPTHAIMADTANLAQPVFNLGDLNNTDRDADSEYVVIEFNALVQNIPAVQDGGALAVTYVVKADDAAGLTSDPITLNVVEPTLAIDKQLTNVSYSHADPADGKVATVTYTVTLTNTSGATAHDVKLTDGLPAGAANFTLLNDGPVTTGGVGAITLDTAEQPDYTIASMADGASVTLTYTVDLPDRTALPAITQAETTWTSFAGATQTLGGTTTGEAGTSIGERTGADGESGLNDYVRSAEVGFGTISGTVWDNTPNQNAEQDAGESPLAGVVVELRRLVAGGTDWNEPTHYEVVVSTTTDATGAYAFTALPPGDYRVVTPDALSRTINGDLDTLTPMVDTDASTSPGTIAVTIAEGGSSTGLNIGYLRENDPPTLTADGKTADIAVSALERAVDAPDTDNKTGISPVPLLTDVKVWDIDLGTEPADATDRANTVFGAGSITVTLADALTHDRLTVESGLPGMTAAGPAVYVVGDEGTPGTLTLTIALLPGATVGQVEAILAEIQYAHDGDDPTDRIARGPDAQRTTIGFDVVLNDGKNSRGVGQDSGSGSAGEAAVSGTITLTPVNDPPVATDDVNTVHEDGVGGPSMVNGNVITGGTPDYDLDNRIDELTVTHIRTGKESEPAGSQDGMVNNTGGSGGPERLKGEYGWLTIYTDGSYTYELDNGDSRVNQLQTGQTLPDHFTYTIADPDDGTDSATLTITIQGHTDGPPAITPVDGNGGAVDGHATVYESGLRDPVEQLTDQSATVTGTITLSAPDNLTSITIKGWEEGGETDIVLDLPTLQGLTGSPVVIDTGEGLLTLTRLDVTSADGQPVTAAELHYSYTLKERQGHPDGSGNNASQDDIPLTLTDGAGVSASGTLTVLIIDDVPTARPDTADVTTYEQTVTGNVFAGTGAADRDTIGADGPAAGGPVTGVKAGDDIGTPAVGGLGGAGVPGTYGDLTLQPDGTYTYEIDPIKLPADFNGTKPPLTDVFTYTITDADGDPATTTLTITIHGNTPPVINPDTNTTPEDVPVSGNVLTNDTDADSDVLTVTSISVGGSTVPVAPGAPGVLVIPGAGTLEMRPDGSYTFTPVPDWHGDVPVVTYTVDDGNGGTGGNTLTITVTPVPDTVNDRAETRVDTPVRIVPLDNDAFSGSSPVVSVQPGDGPSNGSVVVNPDGSVTYTPQPGFVGEDTFTYTVVSGGRTETATVTVLVGNDPPVPLPDTNTVPANTPATGNVLGNDSDPDGHPITVTSYTVEGNTYTPGQPADIPGVGTLVIHPDGSYHFTPEPGWTGDVPPVTYTITDGHPGGEPSSTLNITVTPLNLTPPNLPPVPLPDTNTVPVDTPATGNVLGNDNDPDGDPITVTSYTVEGNTYTPGQPADIPGVGTLVIHPDGSYSFTPEPGWTGDVPPVTYTITDGHPGGEPSSTLNITVTPLNLTPSNLPPVPLPDTNTVPVDTPATGNVLGNDNDPDGDPITVTSYTVEGNTYTPGQPADIPGVGTLVIHPDGSYSFTPEPGWTGDVPPVTYAVTDGQPGTVPPSSTLNITVTPSGLPSTTWTPPQPPAPEPWAPLAVRGDTDAFQRQAQTQQQMRSSVGGDQVRDASVFFDGGVFSKMPRMDLPFHPIVYVNNEVQNAQQQRETDDAHGMGNPGYMPPNDVDSESIGSGLGMDKNLFVQHMVRLSQQRGEQFGRMVDVRYGRVGLGSDGWLPTPGLFESRLAAAAQRAAQQAADEAAQPGDADAPASDPAGTEAPADGAVSMADVPPTVAQAAPAFTEQLRGGAGQLPGAVMAAVPPKVS